MPLDPRLHGGCAVVMKQALLYAVHLLQKITMTLQELLAVPYKRAYNRSSPLSHVVLHTQCPRESYLLKT